VENEVPALSDRNHYSKHSIPLTALHGGLTNRNQQYNGLRHRRAGY